MLEFKIAGNSTAPAFFSLTGVSRVSTISYKADVVVHDQRYLRRDTSLNFKVRVLLLTFYVDCGIEFECVSAHYWYIGSFGCYCLLCRFAVVVNSFHFCLCFFTACNACPCPVSHIEQGLFD